MADLPLERFTACATGRPEDVLACEIVLQDDDARSAKDPTPRTTTVARLVTRGDLRALLGATREVLLTSGRDADRIILRAVAISRLRGHLSVDLSALGLAIDWYVVDRGRVRVLHPAWDCRIGPVVETVAPEVGQRLDAHLAAQQVARGR